MLHNNLIKKTLLQWYLNNGVDINLGPLKSERLEKKNKIDTQPKTSNENFFSKALKDCNSITLLKDIVNEHSDCALKNTAKNLVFADGNPTAQVMLLGEAPGEEEDKIGKPFAGAAGKLLDKMLEAIELNRKNTYLSNVVFWRPPGNRKPTEEEIDVCLPFVIKHIELIKPKILILAGATAAKALYKLNTAITQISGNWRNLNIGEHFKVNSIAIFHPAFLLRQPARKREAWEDLKKIKMKIDKNT